MVLPTPGGSKVYGTDLSCQASICYIVENGNSASKDVIIGFNPSTGAIISNQTIGSLAISLSTINGNGNDAVRDLPYFSATCTNTARILLNPTGQSIGTCAGSNLNAFNVRGGAYDGTQYVGVLTDSAFTVWDITTTPTTLVCSTAVTPSASPVGHVEYFDGFFYVVNTASTIDQWTTACVRSANYITGTGITTMKAVLFSDSLNAVFVVGQTSTAVMNITSSQYSTLLYTIAYGNVAQSTDSSIIATNMNQMAFLGSSEVRIFQIDPVEESETGGGETPNSEFCADPDNAFVLICRLETQQGSLTGASNLVNQSATNIICQIGLLQCTQGTDGNFTPTDGDIQTNGVGYLLLAILIAIWVGIMWVASRGQLTEIPTFIWFIGIIAIVGVITAFGWINPTFLIIAVVAVAGFAVAKARGVFGGQLFTGEAS